MFNPNKIQKNGGCPHYLNNGANNPPACNISNPTATLSADSYDINVGGSTNLHGSCTNAASYSGTSPIGSGSWSGTQINVSTSQLNTPGPQPYQFTCYSGASQTGTSNTDSVTINVHSPQVFITANPARVRSGDSSVISWSATDVKEKSCTISGPGLSITNVPPLGFFSIATTSSGSISIIGQSTYTITCSKKVDSSPITSWISVNILPIFQEF